MKRTPSIITLLLLAALLSGCGKTSGLQDGYYTAQASEYNFGWKEYTRYYAGQLLDGQREKEIDVITGASSSYSSFQKLAEAVLEQAKKGDSDVVYVDTSH